MEEIKRLYEAVMPNQPKYEKQNCEQKPYAALCRAQISSTVTQAHSQLGAQHQRYYDKKTSWQAISRRKSCSLEMTMPKERN